MAVDGWLGVGDCRLVLRKELVPRGGLVDFKEELVLVGGRAPTAFAGRTAGGAPAPPGAAFGFLRLRAGLRFFLSCRPCG